LNKNGLQNRGANLGISSFCTLQLVGNGKAAGRSGATNAALQPSFDLRRLLYVLFDRLAGRWPDWTRQYRCGFMIWDEAPSCTLAVLLIEDNQASAGCYEFLIYQIDCHKYNHKNQRLSLSIIIMGSRYHFTAFADPTLLLVLDPTLWRLQRMARGSLQGIRERLLPLSGI